MVPERMARRLGAPLLLAVTVLLIASHCSSGDSPPPVAAGTVTAGRTTPSAAAVSAPASVAPLAAGAPTETAVPAEPRAALALGGGVLFAGRTLIYATHGFSAAEVSTLAGKVSGPVTAVYSSEQLVASGVASFPDIAVDTLIADPDSYASAANVPTLAGLLRQGLVLATDEARLRNVGVGGLITFTDGTRLPVSAVVDAHVLGGHEMATALGKRPLVAGATANYLLVGGMPSVAELTSVAHTVWPTRTIRVKTSTANGYLSGSDTVLTQLQSKLAFGEFSSRPAGTDAFVPDPAWINRHLVSKRVVQLGDVTCNSAVMGDLEAAMKEITAKGLGSLIDTADFQYEGGCWNPRTARVIAGGTLSSHSWGIAIDINVAANPLGAPPHQDPRLVAIMAAHGFAWGGRFLRPDGAHFEWVGTIAH